MKRSVDAGSDLKASKAAKDVKGVIDLTDGLCAVDPVFLFIFFCSDEVAKPSSPPGAVAKPSSPPGAVAKPSSPPGTVAKARKALKASSVIEMASAAYSSPSSHVIYCHTGHYYGILSSGLVAVTVARHSQQYFEFSSMNYDLQPAGVCVCLSLSDALMPIVHY